MNNFLKSFLYLLLVLWLFPACSRFGCKSRPSDNPEGQLVSRKVVVNDPFRVDPVAKVPEAQPTKPEHEELLKAPDAGNQDEPVPPPVAAADVVSTELSDAPAPVDAASTPLDVQVAVSDPGQAQKTDTKAESLPDVPEHARHLLGIDIIMPDDVSQVANETLREDCEAGKQRACDFLFKRLQKGCLWADQDSCATLGYMLQSGLGVPADPEKALVFLEKSCTDGHPSGCTWLAGAYLDGKGVLINEIKAADLYQKGCDLGNHMACNNLGFLHREGRGVALDDGRAFELFDQSCKGGELRGCLNLARSYEKGLGVSKDEPKANELYLIACDSGLYFACYYMGLKYEKGVSVEEDSIKATSLFRIACDNGVQRACKHLD